MVEEAVLRLPTMHVRASCGGDRIHAGAVTGYPRVAAGLGSKVGPMLGLRA